MKRRTFHQVVAGVVAYSFTMLPSSAAIVYSKTTLSAATSYSNNWINVTGYSTSSATTRLVLNHRSTKMGSGIGGTASQTIRVTVSAGGVIQWTSGLYTVSSSSYTPLTIPIVAPSGYHNVTLQVRNPQSTGGSYYRYEANLFQLEN